MQREKSKQLPLPFRGVEGVTLDRIDLSRRFGERTETKERIIKAIKERQRKDINDKKRELIIKKASELPINITELEVQINRAIDDIKIEESYIAKSNQRYMEYSDYYDLRSARIKFDSLNKLKELFSNSEFTSNVSKYETLIERIVDPNHVFHITDPNLRKRVAFMLALRMFIRKNPEIYDRYSNYV